MMIDPFIKSSFGVLLKLHEVTQYYQFIAVLADARTAITVGGGQVGFYHGTIGRAVLRGE